MTDLDGVGAVYLAWVRHLPTFTYFLLVLLQKLDIVYILLLIQTLWDWELSINLITCKPYHFGLFCWFGILNLSLVPRWNILIAISGWICLQFNWINRWSCRAVMIVVQIPHGYLLYFTVALGNLIVNQPWIQNFPAWVINVISLSRD